MGHPCRVGDREEGDIGLHPVHRGVLEEEIGEALQVGVDRVDPLPGEFREVARTTSAEGWVRRSRIRSPPVQPEAPIIAIFMGKDIRR